MPYFVTGSPVEAFADAILNALRADRDASTPGTLAQLLGGADQVATRIVAATRTGARTAMPYVVVGDRTLHEGSVAMQQEGGALGLMLHVWSEQNGPHEVQAIQSRIRALLPRDRTLAMPGYVLYAGSLACDEERVFSDFDPDMPQRSLFHGVQHLIADVETA